MPEYVQPLLSLKLTWEPLTFPENTVPTSDVWLPCPATRQLFDPLVAVSVTELPLCATVTLVRPTQLASSTALLMLLLNAHVPEMSVALPGAVLPLPEHPVAATPASNRRLAARAEERITAGTPDRRNRSL